MNINECKKYCHQKYKFKVRNIVDNQIENFFQIENSNFNLSKHNYKIGDNVILSPMHFLHGTGKNEEAIEFIAKNGILSKEATGNLGHHAFEFGVGFWRVKDKITLKEYIINYSGMDIRYNDENYLVPYGKLDKFVEDMKDIDHWLWEGISSMEIRFMPSLARDINQYGFILNIESKEAQTLVKNDVNSYEFDKNISKHFSSLFKEKDKNKIKQNTFLNRASYIVFGMNKCFIEGIIVGRKVEKSKTKLKHLKSLFPSCYISNLDGKVILE